MVYGKEKYCFPKSSFENNSSLEQADSCFASFKYGINQEVVKCNIVIVPIRIPRYMKLSDGFQRKWNNGKKNSYDAFGNIEAGSIQHLSQSYRIWQWLVTTWKFVHFIPCVRGTLFDHWKMVEWLLLSWAIPSIHKYTTTKQKTFHYLRTSIQVLVWGVLTICQESSVPVHIIYEKQILPTPASNIVFVLRGQTTGHDEIPKSV